MKFTIDYFKSLGLSVGLDWPYSGTIVPTLYYKKDNNVNSIMIEINRKLYLTRHTFAKSENYVQIKGLIYKYLNDLKTAFYT